VRRIRPGVPALPSGPATASALGVLGVVFLAAAVPPALIAGDFSAGNAASNALIAASYGGVGLVVARRQPRNAVGWILLCFGVMLAASSAAGSYAALIYRSGHGWLPLGPAAVLLDLLWAPAIGLIPLAVLLFPDGTLPSPRGR
jgi:two-component system, NarL family, sensor kinase